MPVARFQMPDGRIARFEVAEGTTPEQAQTQMQAFMANQQPKQDQALFGAPAAPTPESQAQAAAMGAGTAQSVLEPAAAIASGAIAEPIAGAAGIGSLLRGQSPEQAQTNIEATREALTYTPQSEAGKEATQAIGETLAPVGKKLQEVRKNTGDLALKLTGSPTVAAIATALPDATIEALGFGVGRRAAQGATGIKAAPSKIKPPAKVSERAVTKSLLESAPEVSQIKDASRAIYKEIDDLNVAVKPGATSSLIRKVVGKAKKENVDNVLTPKSARVVDQLIQELDNPKPRTISDLDQIRRKAQIAAQSIDPSDARVGAIMVDEIDDFLDKIPQGAFSGPDAKTVGQIGERYKAARGLWGRARRAELISDAFEKANLQASGFENGVRTQLRSIVNNKKRARFFTKDEINAMKDVIKGSNDANILKLVGRLGFSEGSATNVLGGLGGMAVLGPVAPAIGQISRKLAQKTTEAAAKKMEVLIRGGAKGREITKTYLQQVPKGKRSIEELSDMLLSSGADLDELLKSSNKFAKEAAEITRARKLFERSEAAGAAAPAVMTQQEQQ